MEVSPYPQRGTLRLNAIRLALKFLFVIYLASLSMSSTQVAPQAEIQSNRHAHHYQRANTQDHEPPDHAHEGQDNR